jgi:prepilin-type N-terminal cleavage/methylation domain-containing protein
MKRGYTLIEVVVALSLISILLSTVILVFSRLRIEFSHKIDENRESYYFNEALMFIEDELGKGGIAVNIEHNSIHIVYDECDKKIIEQKDDELIVRYGTTYSMNKSYNKIACGILEFQVNERGNLIYVKINSKKGRSKERCFVLKR